VCAQCTAEFEEAFHTQQRQTIQCILRARSSIHDTRVSFQPLHTFTIASWPCMGISSTLLVHPPLCAERLILLITDLQEATSKATTSLLQVGKRGSHTCKELDKARFCLVLRLPADSLPSRHSRFGPGNRSRKPNTSLYSHCLLHTHKKAFASIFLGVGQAKTSWKLGIFKVELPPLPSSSKHTHHASRGIPTLT
jgi:hypothetical protein